jgi:hypothetical protein
MEKNCRVLTQELPYNCYYNSHTSYVDYRQGCPGRLHSKSTSLSWGIEPQEIIGLPADISLVITYSQNRADIWPIGPISIDPVGTPDEPI